VGDAGFSLYSSGGAAPDAGTNKVAAHIGVDASRSVEVPDSTVSFLLAAGGKQIKALEDGSGCRVVVDRAEGARGKDAARHSGDRAARKVTLIGSEAALREGERRLQEAVAASGKFIQKTIRCNATQAGSIIGRGGAIVKRLQAATATHISVSGREDGGGSADAPRTVSIKGAPWNVEVASRFIFAAMRDPAELSALIADAETAQAAGVVGRMPTGAGGYGDAAAFAAQFGSGK
jgi:rRNA processing protein Krr1/Pno1